MSNRIAFAWKLASLGVPVILIYLGFWGDAGSANAGKPFYTEQEWRSAFGSHVARVFDESAFGKRIDCGAAPFWLLVESKPVKPEAESDGQRSG